MYSIWTKNLKDQADKAQFEKSLRNSRWILERQSEVIQEMIDSTERNERSPKVYDTPNWDYKQAHCNGFLQALYRIKELNNLDQKDSNDPGQSITS